LVGHGRRGGARRGPARQGAARPGEARQARQARQDYAVERGEPPLFAVAGTAGAGRTSKEWMTFIFCRTRQAPRNT